MRENIRKIIGALFVLTSFGMTSYVSIFCVDACENPKNISFENVNVLVLGRCRTITTGISWLKRLFIGDQTYFGVLVSDTPHETVRIIIFNQSHLKGARSIEGVTNTNVFMQNVKGIFFYGCGKSFCISKIPPIVFVYCHVDIMWILEYSTV